MTQRFEIHPTHPQPRLVRPAAAILREGGLVVLPTDACYVLACHLADKAAVDRLRAIRAVDDRHLLTLMCRDLKELATYAQVDNRQYRFLRDWTPGPYTFVLPATREVPRRLWHPSRKTIGLRVPSSPVAAGLLEAHGAPLLGSSLILPGESDPLHGDTIATITGTTVTAGYVYDPFGQPINTSSGAVDLAATPTTRTGTTTDAWHGSAQRGYEHSSGLNQILMGARTYLPDLGIFTATDPVEGGNTTTYTYPQDPINAQDLDGLGQRGRRRVKMTFSAEEQEFLKLSKQEQNLPENRALRNSVRQKTIANQKAAGTRNVAKRAPKGGGRAITSPKAAAVEGGGSSARSSGRGGIGGGALALLDFSGYLLEGGNIMSGRGCRFYCLELFPISVAEMMPA